MKTALEMTRQMSKYLGVVLVALLFISLYAPATNGVDRFPSGALVVDVRTVREFQAAHFPQAKNIPLAEIQDRISEFGPKDRAIVVYCRSGRRSGISKIQLEKAGYTNVQNGGALHRMMERIEK